MYVYPNEDINNHKYMPMLILIYDKFESYYKQKRGKELYISEWASIIQNKLKLFEIR